MTVQRHKGAEYLDRLIAADRFGVDLGLLGDTAVEAHRTDEIAGGEAATVVEIGAVHEFGSEAHGVPARAPIGTASAAHGREWSAQLATAVQVHARGGNGAQRVRLLGVEAVADLRQGIVEHLPPPLSELTIEMKTGSARKETPLIDTGQLYRSYRARALAPGHTPQIVGA